MRIEHAVKKSQGMTLEVVSHLRGIVGISYLWMHVVKGTARHPGRHLDKE